MGLELNLDNWVDLIRWNKGRRKARWGGQSEQRCREEKGAWPYRQFLLHSLLLCRHFTFHHVLRYMSLLLTSEPHFIISKMDVLHPSKQYNISFKIFNEHYLVEKVHLLA